MPARIPLDAIDHQIIELLRENARRTIADIAGHVNLSAAPVKRRIERLEQRRVITGYSASIDESQINPALEAFIELRFSGRGDVDTISAQLRHPREVIEVSTVAGDPDAVVRIRVDDVHHLKRVVNELRKVESVTGTKTLMILDRWSR